MTQKYHVKFDFTSSISISELRKIINDYVAKVPVGTLVDRVHVVRVRSPKKVQSEAIPSESSSA